jgi:hypothetical protein
MQSETTVNALALSLGSIFLQITATPVAGVDFVTILDKITTIGILMYISVTLNKKMETMTVQFRDEEKEIRKDFKESLKEMNEGFEKRLNTLLENLKK